MPGQIFKTLIEKEFFFEFLEKNCVKQKDHYLVNKISFKKALYNNSLNNFCMQIKNNYYKSKQYYVTRKLTYSKFTTIIRQICKSLEIKYESQIKYDKSVYNIVYRIFFHEEDDDDDNKDNDGEGAGECEGDDDNDETK